MPWGGVAWGDVDTHVRIVGTPLLSGSETQTGWTAGFGLEHAFTERISTRIEYAHIDLGSETQNLKFTGGIVPAIPDKVDARMDTLRLGVNLKLTN
jgi:outer membrane immunogenic protein